MTPEEVWRRYDAMEARLSAPLSERMLELAGVQKGQRVLDLASGRGEPAIRAARRVGPGGSVLGIDVSEPMLAMARERAAREKITNLELRVANAESIDLPEGAFDVVLARWGLMYMDDPVAALAAARRALVPEGVLVAAVWAEPERVSYVTLPRRLLERHCALPPLDVDGPGTFRYADRDRLHRDLEAAGLRATHEEEMDVDIMEAETGAEVVAWTRAFGMTRLLEGLPEEIQRAWEDDLARAAEPLRKDGMIRLGGVTRIVVAKTGTPLAGRATLGASS